VTNQSISLKQKRSDACHSTRTTARQSRMRQTTRTRTRTRISAVRRARQSQTDHNTPAHTHLRCDASYHLNTQESSEQLSGYRGDFRKPNKTLKKGLRQHNDLHPSPTNWTNRIIHLLLTSHWTFTPHSNFACPNLLKNPGVATILTIPSPT
jgi:hypothetical protein